MLRVPAVAAVAVLVLLAGCLQGGTGTTGTAGASGSGTTGPATQSTGRTGTAATGAPGSTGSTTSSAPTAPATGRAFHERVWLCQDPVGVDDLSTSAKESLSCDVGLTFTSTQVSVQATGIPNHDFQSGAGCCAKAQAYVWKLPLRPTMASASTAAPLRGPIAVAVNGAAIFGPEDGDSSDVVRHTHTTTSGEPRVQMCDAHSTPQGVFHYHADGHCIHWHPDAGQAWTSYGFDEVDPSTPSGVLGFAFDGIPIYGAYADEGGDVLELTSSYQLKAGKTGSGGVADYEYVAGLGDLDECNGRVERNADFPDGAYVYHSTMHNGDGDLGFPYFPLCYKGVVERSNLQAAGGMPPRRPA